MAHDPSTDAASTRPSWDDYFLALAEQVSKRSPDPNTKHGCVIIDSDKRVLSTGYNGPVSGLPHDLIDFTRPGKYDWFIHAEDNAVAFARCDLRGASAYVTGTPCAACFRRLLQVGIRRIVQGERVSACLTEREFDACRDMARALGVEWVSIARPNSTPASMIESHDVPIVEVRQQTSPAMEPKS